MGKTTKKTNQYGALGNKKNLDKLLSALGAKTVSTSAINNANAATYAADESSYPMPRNDEQSKGGAGASDKSNPYGYESEGKMIPYRNDEQAAVGGYYGQEAANAMTARHASALSVGAPAKTMNYYNPQSLAGSKKTYDTLKLAVDEMNNAAWDTTKEKKNKIKSLVEAMSGDFAKNFNTQDEFNQAMQTQDFQNLMKSYQKMGGDPNSIASKVAQPVVATAQDGTYAGAESEYNMDGTQSMTDYLGTLSSPAEQKALETLLPEQKIAQDRIALENNILEQNKQYYFGTADQIGFVQREKKLKEEEIKIIEREAKMNEENIRAQGDYAIQKNAAESERDAAEIEENRLNSKNYMTGMLAKMGALKTTGAAPQALATLEQKYQKQAMDTRNDYKFQNMAIELKMNETIDAIQIGRDKDIWQIKNDLSKSEEQTWKEIMNAQNDADRKSLAIIDDYVGKFRVQKDKYIAQAKADAKAYASKFASTISAYDLEGVLEGDIAIKRGKTGKIADLGILTPTGAIASIESKLEASKGADGYVNSKVYQEMLDKFIQAGGTRSEFINKFPPNEYTNPKDETLPTFLRFGSSSRAEAPKEDEREI